MAQGKPTILTKEQLELVEKCSSKFWAIKEIASLLNIHPDTLSDRYKDIIEKGRENGKGNLRDLQLKAALNGNVTMLIWLGKQYLNQRDSQIEITAEEAKKTIIYQIENNDNIEITV